LKSIKNIHSNEQGIPIDTRLFDLEEIHLDNSDLELTNKLIYENSFESGKILLVSSESVVPVDLQQRRITGTVTDKDGNPERYMLSPTSRELKKLLKLETFTDTTEYRRISPEFQW